MLHAYSRKNDKREIDVRTRRLHSLTRNLISNNYHRDSSTMMNYQRISINLCY